MNAFIKTVVVDDEPGCIDRLNKDLTTFPDIKVVETSTSAASGKQAVLKYQPDLLFLDIEMPGVMGTELLQEIQPYVHPNMCVVFYTAHKKYQIDAIRASAFDYLLKPYKKEELSFIINRVQEKLNSGQNIFHHLIQHLSVYDKGFAIQIPTGIMRLRASEALYFRCEKRAWMLVVADRIRNEYALRSTTKSKDILEKYPSFFQISQDYILNLDYMVSLEKSHDCVLQPPFNDLKLRVSKSIYPILKKKFLSL